MSVNTSSGGWSLGGGGGLYGTDMRIGPVPAFWGRGVLPGAGGALAWTFGKRNLVPQPVQAPTAPAWRSSKPRIFVQLGHLIRIMCAVSTPKGGRGLLLPPVYDRPGRKASALVK